TTGADNRFSFSVPATRKERILRLYVQSKNAETGLTAKLEQGAGRPIVTMKEDVASDGTSSRIYTISFQSDRDRDRMNVVWELKKPTDDAENHLGIQAVSLQ
ncbi:MAG: hypothetical protein SFU56_02900, partial [Capsulimonadales bacterium]|nr:hypothetical protein [Capsulimonadales bacterium]